MEPIPPQPPRSTWLALVEAALREDLGPGDVTSQALLSPEHPGRAQVEAREPLVLCGTDVAREVFVRCGADFEPLAADGDALEPGSFAALVVGRARDLLAAERVALNFLQHLSGVATLTRRYVEAVASSRAQIVDTRKTTPGWRALEKYAVRCGGGKNHRMGLFDGVLIKDNHVAAIGSVADAVKRARESAPASLRIQVEVESLEQALAALEAGAELLLLDNLPPVEMRRIAERIAGRVPLEASGGITLENVAAVAASGVDRISIGALTHSAPAVDLALEWNADSPI